MPELTRKKDPIRPELPQRTAGPLSVPVLTPPVLPARQDAPHRERRDLASRAELLRRMEVEYHEMPGLSLTLPRRSACLGCAKTSALVCSPR
jgi:hypothetical protein